MPADRLTYGQLMGAKEDGPRLDGTLRHIRHQPGPVGSVRQQHGLEPERMLDARPDLLVSERQAFQKLPISRGNMRAFPRKGCGGCH